MKFYKSGLTNLKKLKKMKQLNETITPTSKDFNVFSYSICNTDGLFEYSHWTEGLKMIIIKNGITIELEPNEIQQLVNTLPRTFGQSYKQKN
jgi:hypothetical protein